MSVTYGTTGMPCGAIPYGQASMAGVAGTFGTIPWPPRRSISRSSGAALLPRRDCHLGCLSPRQMARFPAHIHGVRHVLTLQGAVAHCDLPAGTGPTMLLALSRPKVQAHFAQHHVQLPLQKGDTPFFDPAVMGDGNGEPH